MIKEKRPKSAEKPKPMSGKKLIAETARSLSAKFGFEIPEDHLQRGAGVASSILGRITGFGDYKVKMNNVTMPGSFATSNARFASNEHTTIIRHRELVGPVTPTTAAFQITKYPINPGLPKSFPWMSLMASGFEEYEVRGLVYEYESTASEYNATPGMGSVIMATNYDSADADFYNFVQMSSYEYSTSCKPSVSMMHPVECDPKLRVLQRSFTRTDSIALTKSSIQFYDIGNFYIATNGLHYDVVNNSVQLGLLYVTYEIAFTKPRLPLVPLNAQMLSWHNLPSTLVEAEWFQNNQTPYLGGTANEIIHNNIIYTASDTRPVVFKNSTSTAVYDLVFSLPGHWLLTVSGSNINTVSGNSPSIVSTQGGDNVIVDYNFDNDPNALVLGVAHASGTSGPFVLNSTPAHRGPVYAVSVHVLQYGDGPDNTVVISCPEKINGSYWSYSIVRIPNFTS